MNNADNTLYFIHDPMCSWCWAFKNVWHELRIRLPDNISVKYLLAGLASDSDQPMSDEMKQHVIGNWKRIEQTVPDVSFNYDFWEKCQPRRLTYPACRAVIATRMQDETFEFEMIDQIQQAYYQNAQNPSDETTLIALANKIGLDADQFTKDLNSVECRDSLQQEINQCRAFGIASMPSLVLKTSTSETVIELDYLNADVMLKQIISLINET